jgi:preprotein translocase subunit SecG
MMFGVPVCFGIAVSNPSTRGFAMTDRRSGKGKLPALLLLGLGYWAVIGATRAWYLSDTLPTHLDPGTLGLTSLTLLLSAIFLIWILRLGSFAGKLEWQRIPLLLIPGLACVLMNYRLTVLASDVLAKPTLDNLKSISWSGTIYLAILFVWIMIFPLRSSHRSLSARAESVYLIGKPIAGVSAALYISLDLWRVFRMLSGGASASQILLVEQALRRATITLLTLFFIVLHLVVLPYIRLTPKTEGLAS